MSTVRDTLISLVMLALLAMIGSLFYDTRTERIEQAIREQSHEPFMKSCVTDGAPQYVCIAMWRVLGLL